MPTQWKALLALLLLACAPLTAQSAAAALGTAPASQPAAAGKSYKVLCSVFPVYLFTKMVTDGSNVQVDLMLPSTTGCPHDYVLTPQDMRKIAAADVLVVNGLGLEEFLGEPVGKANSSIRIIKAGAGITDLIQMKEDPHEQEGHRRHEGPNPHVFANPRMAAQMVLAIAQELARTDADNAPLFAANAKAQKERLLRLDREFSEAAATFRSRKIVTEHAVFDYLARDLRLQVVAVIEEAPGQAPSAATMLEIVRRIRATGAVAVFTEPQYSTQVSQTIAAEAKVPVAQLDPVASGPADAGVDYYEKTMRDNLDTLVRVLGKEGK